MSRSQFGLLLERVIFLSSCSCIKYTQEKQDTRHKTMKIFVIMNMMEVMMTIGDELVDYALTKSRLFLNAISHLWYVIVPLLAQPIPFHPVFEC